MRPSRPSLTLRLPVVLIRWSAFILLTGCKPRPSSLTNWQLIPTSDRPNQACKVRLCDLSKESSEATFKQFFEEREATAIWERLRFLLDNPQKFGGIDETILDKDSDMKQVLSNYKGVEANLRTAISLYIVHKKQLCPLPLQVLTEEEFRKLLLDNRLDSAWARLDKARARSKRSLELNGILQGSPEVQSQVLAGLAYFIPNYCPDLVELDLSCNGLTTLPESFGQLMKLCVLNLSNNGLIALPDSFGNLIQLKILNLRHNQLTTLPDSFGNLTQLQILELGSNRLIALHGSFGSLVQLRILYLHNNQLTTLPDSFGKLTQLQILFLQCNQLTTLPDSFGELAQLEILELGSNRLTVLPASFGNLINLNQLNLSYNQLTTLPEFFGNLTQLKRLYLHTNQLTTLPKSFGGLTQLQKLDLSFNQLTTLPKSFGGLISLQELDLIYNQLTCLPGSLQKLTKLRDFTVEDNPLLDSNDPHDDIGVWLTSSNVNTLFFPSLTERAAKRIVQDKTSYNTTGHPTIPHDCISHIQHPNTYAVILFVRQLGDVTLDQPVPLYLNLTCKEIVDHVYANHRVIVTKQGIIKRANRQ